MIASFVTTRRLPRHRLLDRAAAVAAMDLYGRYLWYVSLAILVVVVWQSWRASATEQIAR